MVQVQWSVRLEIALTVGAEVIGINNRDLDDFSVDVQTTFELITDVPAGETVVSESGIAERSHARGAGAGRVGAVLIPRRGAREAGRQPGGQGQGAAGGRGVAYAARC